MHGLANKCLQGFLQDTYGDATWRDVARRAGLGLTSFEPMMTYDDRLTDAMLKVAGRTLRKPVPELLEDAGNYLVSHPNMSRMRRLLRFGGDDFVAFLHSLDDLPERVRLVLPSEPFPTLDLTELGDGVYHLQCRGGPPGAEHVVMGALRAMADDYGALVLLGWADPAATDPAPIELRVLSASFAQGRSFALAEGRS